MERRNEQYLYARSGAIQSASGLREWFAFSAKRLTAGGCFSDERERQAGGRVPAGSAVAER